MYELGVDYCAEQSKTHMYIENFHLWDRHYTLYKTQRLSLPHYDVMGTYRYVHAIV